MQPKFIAEYKTTKEHAKSLYFYILFLTPLRIVANVLMLVVLLYAVYQAIFEYYVDMFYFVFVPLVYAFEVFQYFRMVSRFEKVQNEVDSKDVVHKYEFFDDHFVSSSSEGVERKVEYNVLKSFAKTKKLIILKSKAKIIYVIPIDALGADNAEKLVDFIHKKGIIKMK